MWRILNQFWEDLRYYFDFGRPHRIRGEIAVLLADAERLESEGAAELDKLHAAERAIEVEITTSRAEVYTGAATLADTLVRLREFKVKLDSINEQADKSMLKIRQAQAKVRQAAALHKELRG